MERKCREREKGNEGKQIMGRESKKREVEKCQERDLQGKGNTGMSRTEEGRERKQIEALVTEGLID